MSPIVLHQNAIEFLDRSTYLYDRRERKRSTRSSDGLVQFIAIRSTKASANYLSRRRKLTLTSSSDVYSCTRAYICRWKRAEAHSLMRSTKRNHRSFSAPSFNPFSGGKRRKEKEQSFQIFYRFPMRIHSAPEFADSTIISPRGIQLFFLSGVSFKAVGK